MNKKNIILLILIFWIILIVAQKKESTALNKAINKIYDATVYIEKYDSNAIKKIGTGFFYKKDNKYGYIITNEHVIRDGKEVDIVTSKDETVKADILGKDEYLDIAVLRVDKKYAKQIATIGNSNKSSIGDSIFTVGSPLGYRQTVTTGIISAKDRLVKVDTSDDETLMKLIQINAGINDGNSGGALLNMKGEVIGICSLKLADNNIEDIGFAIPIEYAMKNIKYLEENKKIKYPTLGIKIVNSNETSELLKNNIDINQEDGLIVLENKKSLKKGDLITKINNHEIKDILTLKCELLEYKTKDKVTLTIIRKNKKMNIKLTLS